MPHRRFLALIVMTGVSGLYGLDARAHEPPLYEVYAVRYGTLPGCPVSFLVQGAEPQRKVDLAMTFWVLKGPDGRTVLVDAGFYRPQFFKEFKLNTEGRVRLVDGDAKEILPGVTVFTGGKHTFASQFVGVNTKSGRMVVASDNVYLYENLEKHVPITATLDAKSNLAAQDRMKQLATNSRLIIPGHDPEVFVRFPKPGNGVAQLD